MKRSGALAGSLCGLAALLIAVLVLLGNWQLKRLDWKLDLIDAIAERTQAPPVPAPTDAIDADRDVYRRVVASGRFRHEHARQIKALTEIGAGYWVLTPLEGDRHTVWVNRGFVSGERRERGRYDEPPGGVTVDGLLRISEPIGTLLQKNAPSEGRWFSRDVEALSADTGIDAHPDYFIDAGFPGSTSTGGWPRAGLTRLDYRNPHLAYALTWYGMAIGLAAALAYVIHLEVRRRSA